MVSYCEVFANEPGCPGYDASQDPTAAENQEQVDAEGNPVIFEDDEDQDTEVSLTVTVERNENATERVVRM